MAFNHCGLPHFHARCYKNYIKLSSETNTVLEFSGWAHRELWAWKTLQSAGCSWKLGWRWVSFVLTHPSLLHIEVDTHGCLFINLSSLISQCRWTSYRFVLKANNINRRVKLYSRTALVIETRALNGFYTKKHIDSMRMAQNSTDSMDDSTHKWRYYG